MYAYTATPYPYDLKIDTGFNRIRCPVSGRGRIRLLQYGKTRIRYGPISNFERP